MLNIVVVRPMPNASASTATALNARLLARERAPYRMSRRTARMGVEVGGFPDLRAHQKGSFRLRPADGRSPPFAASAPQDRAARRPPEVVTAQPIQFQPTATSDLP